jgi:hypothetical protein
LARLSRPVLHERDLEGTVLVPEIHRNTQHRVRKMINFLAKRALSAMFGKWPKVPVDNTYAWLGHTFQELMRIPLSARKPMYVWGVAQGAALAKVLRVPEISVIELGVAGGAGLLSLEHTAQLVEARAGIKINVYGFDTGTGLPKPTDYRDQPNMWFEGQLPMKRDLLESKLRRASLRIGLVRDTIAEFVSEQPPPVAFISFDLDLYNSTRDALAIFDSPYELLLPRVATYFDDILGHTYNDFAGERLAITEFNNDHSTRKLSPIYGLRNFVPRESFFSSHWDSMFFAHFFEHPLYNALDSTSKAVFTDHLGYDFREPVGSDWKARLQESPEPIL